MGVYFSKTVLVLGQKKCEHRYAKMIGKCLVLQKTRWHKYDSCSPRNEQLTMAELVGENGVFFMWWTNALHRHQRINGHNQPAHDLNLIAPCKKYCLHIMPDTYINAYHNGNLTASENHYHHLPTLIPSRNSSPFTGPHPLFCPRKKNRPKAI